MARQARETVLSADYISQKLGEVSAALITSQSRILEMISDSTIEIDASEMRSLASNVASIRDTSDSLFRLLEAFCGRIEREADLRSRLERLENGKSEAEPPAKPAKSKATANAA